MSIWIILGAAAASWLFGAVYYGVLGKPWMTASEFTDEQRARVEAGPKGNPAPFILSFLGEIVMGLVLALLIRGIQSEGVFGGVLMGITCWLGFVLTTIATNNAYGMKRYALTAIDGGHWLGVLVIQGAVLGYFARF
jgi:hypothetical protein